MLPRKTLPNSTNPSNSNRTYLEFIEILIKDPSITQLFKDQIPVNEEPTKKCSEKELGFAEELSSNGAYPS